MKSSSQRLFVIWLLFLMASCGRVEKHYNNYAEAERAGAIHENSFLPACLPISAHDINLQFDPDTDDGKGSFAFSPDETKAFKEKLIHYRLTSSAGGVETYQANNHTLNIDWAHSSVTFKVGRIK